MKQETCKRGSEELHQNNRTESSKYEGFGWIKVKRERAVTIDGVKYVTEAHHVAETEFLISRVRELAAKVDTLQDVQEPANKPPKRQTMSESTWNPAMRAAIEEARLAALRA